MNDILKRFGLTSGVILPIALFALVAYTITDPRRGKSISIDDILNIFDTNSEPACSPQSLNRDIEIINALKRAGKDAFYDHAKETYAEKIFNVAKKSDDSVKIAAVKAMNDIANDMLYRQYKDTVFDYISKLS